MSPDVWGWIGGALIGLASILASAVSSRRTNRAKARLDEVSAYSQMVADLRGEVDRLQEDLTELRRLLATAQTDNDALRRQIATLQRTVDRLTSLLRQHQIPVPQEA